MKLGKNFMKATIKQLNGLTFMGKGDSNHWVPMDTSKNFSGNEAGATPMELVLLGLGGCTGMDVISILTKKRSPVENFEVVLEAEQAESFPKVFTKIKIKFIFYGDKDKIKPKDIEQAIELSSGTYCSVSNMLNKTADIEYEYEIIQK